MREPLLTDNAPASLWQAGGVVLLLLWPLLWLGRRHRRFAGGCAAFLGGVAAHYRKAQRQSQYSYNVYIPHLP